MRLIINESFGLVRTSNLLRLVHVTVTLTVVTLTEQLCKTMINYSCSRRESHRLRIIFFPYLLSRLGHVFFFGFFGGKKMLVIYKLYEF